MNALDTDVLRYAIGDSVTDKRGTVIRIDGIRDNLSPKACYRCKCHNTGPQVVVLHEIIPFKAARTLWWHVECANAHFDQFKSTLADTDLDGAF